MVVRKDAMMDKVLPLEEEEKRDFKLICVFCGTSMG